LQNHRLQGVAGCVIPWRKAVSTRRDRYDYNGLNREGFHQLFTRQGKLRGGLEFLQEPRKVLPPWLAKTDH
jgi:hypothetical protein